MLWIAQNIGGLDDLFTLNNLYKYMQNTQDGKEKHYIHAGAK